jgi:hypothetical protein
VSETGIVWIDSEVSGSEIGMRRDIKTCRAMAARMGIPLCASLIWDHTRMDDPYEALHDSLYAHDAWYILTPSEHHIDLHRATDLAELVVADSTTVYPCRYFSDIWAVSHTWKRQS